MDFAELIEQLNRGDESAGPLLVSIVAPRLLGYADQIAGDVPQVDREAAVEKAIETAVRRIDRYDPNKGTFPAWARTFVRHAIQDWRRDHPNGAPVELPSSELIPNPEQDPEQGPEHSARAAALAALVLGESEPNQLLIRLRYVEQFTHEQIAACLDINPANSRKRLERILGRLRTQAADDAELRHYVEGDPE